VTLDVTPDEYYEAPDKHYRRLYASFLGKENGE